MPPKRSKATKKSKAKSERATKTPKPAVGEEVLDKETGELVKIGPQTGLRDRGTSSKIKALAAMLNKKAGGRSFIYPASEVVPVYRLRRPTGIMGLDMATAGGLPAGGITQFIAKDGVGKSTLSNFAMAQNQRIYGPRSAMFVASLEGQYDLEHARDDGVRIAYSEEELDQMEEASGVKFAASTRKAMMEDQVGEIYEPRAETAEDLLQQVIELSRSNLFQIGVIDSIGALLPEAVDEGTMADKHYSGSAMILTQFCQKWWGLGGLKNKNGVFNRTSLIVVNQYRAVIGGPPRGNPMKIQGGHALMHAKFIDVELRSTPGDRIEDDNKLKIGKTVRWTILKAKSGSHEGDKGEYDYLFETSQPDWAKEAFETGVSAGVIERKGTSYYTWEGKQYQGSHRVMRLLEDPDARDRLRTQVLAAKKILCLIGK